MSFPVLNNFVFGTGILYSNIVYFQTYSTTTKVIPWTIPPGITTCRVRLWGGGGGGVSGNPSRPGAGGGFAMKTITSGLTPGNTVSVTVGGGGGGAGGTSSFGSFVAATGGGAGSTTAGANGGSGTTGDVNMRGAFGQPYQSKGGNAGNLFIAYSGTDDNADMARDTTYFISNPVNPLDKIGTGWLFGFLPTVNMGIRPDSNSTTSTTPNPNVPSRQYIGNGLGGASTYIYNEQGSSPGGGGCGQYEGSGIGGPGLVIVEY